jgi:hypothetical protein
MLYRRKIFFSLRGLPLGRVEGFSRDYPRPEACS